PGGQEGRRTLSRNPPLPADHPHHRPLARLRQLVAAPTGPARPAVLLAAHRGRPAVLRGRLAQNAAGLQHHLHGHRQIPALLHHDQRAAVVFPRQGLKPLPHSIKLTLSVSAPLPLTGPPHSRTPPLPVKCLPRRHHSMFHRVCARSPTTTPRIPTARSSSVCWVKSPGG